MVEKIHVVDGKEVEILKGERHAVITDEGWDKDGYITRKTHPELMRTQLITTEGTYYMFHGPIKRETREDGTIVYDYGVPASTFQGTWRKE